MREHRRFGQRTTTRKSSEVKKKYFLVYEGKKTEHRYFEAVDSCRDDLGINPLIELVPILRSYSEDGWSNPEKILNRLIENIKESQESYINHETLLNRIIEYLFEINISKTKKQQVWIAMKQVCEEKLKKSLTDRVDDIDEACRIVMDALREKEMIRKVIENISDVVKDGELTYSEELDEIYLIVDRDKDSFTQYRAVLDKCREEGFQFCVTNPCFEFWLLLHFDAVLNMDKDELLENRKVSSNKRYVEDKLQDVYPRYKKETYNAEVIVKKIDVAIKNAKCFCQDIEELENFLGSNIGMLIENLRNGE